MTNFKNTDEIYKRAFRMKMNRNQECIFFILFSAKDPENDEIT